MSAAGMAKAKEHAFASGAKPRLEERVRERGRRPIRERRGIAEPRTEAGRRRAIARARCRSAGPSKYRNEGAD